ncbi:MAG: hypothetical protein J6S67_04170 [Methanobrevibacter sp.]|nr:hypothetical protein [Methanobrevibacter sp.]
MKKFSIAKYNTERKFNFDVTPIIGKYVKASELGQLIEENGEDHIYTIRGCYLGTIDADASKTGKQQKTASIAIDTTYINVPSFQYETIEGFVNNQDAIDYINSGSAGFMIKSYEMRGETYYKLVFVDIDSDAEI